MSTESEHQDEYHESLVEMLELIWGRGFMTPGGPENDHRDGF